MALVSATTDALLVPLPRDDLGVVTRRSHTFTRLLTGIAFASRAGSAQLGVRLLGAAAKLNDDRGYVAGPRERELERPVVEPGRKGREFSILSPSG